MRFLFVASQPQTEGKTETVSLTIVRQDRKEYDILGSLAWKRPASKNASEWTSPTFDMPSDNGHVVMATSQYLGRFFRMLESDSTMRLADPATVIQAIMRSGGAQAVYDPRMEGYVATDRMTPKGNTKFFPIIDGEPDRKISVAANKEELAKKRIGNKYMEAVKEDPEATEKFMAWLKGGQEVEKLDAVEVPDVPTTSHYFVSVDQEEAMANLESEMAAEKEVRKADRELKKQKKVPTVEKETKSTRRRKKTN